MSVKMRIEVEQKIAKKVIECLLGANLLITVNDGEEDCLVMSSDPEAIFKAMFSTDEDILFAFTAKGDETLKYVHFIYGNSGHDVIHDNTVNLEAILAPASALAEEYA